MTKVLLTGGAGFIGSVLCEELLASSYDVVVLDNFMYRQESLNHLCHNPGFEVVRGDARHGHVLADLLKGADVIIPLAAIVGAPACARDTMLAETTNTSAIAELCIQASKDQRIIIPNTNSGYGIGQPGVECTEDTPMAPVSAYGQQKMGAEKIILERENGISLRLATVFGMSPRMRLDLLVNDFVYRAVRDRALVLFEPHFKRNYIHVRDVAHAFIHAINNFDAMRGQAYNVGLSDANLSKLELCERIKEHLPDFHFLEAPIGTDPDKRDYIVSNAKIEATGFKAEYSLDYGIRELIMGYQMLRDSTHGNV